MFIYRLLLSLLAPAVLALLALRCLRGAETWSDWAERMGRGAEGDVDLWIHGASNGELTSAKPLILNLLERRAWRLAITTNSISGRDLVASWGHPQITARLAPLDFRWSLARFLARHRPKGHLVIENELWPNRLDMLRARQIPVAAAGARLSARSAARWRWFPGLVRRVWQGLSLVSPQSEGDAARIAQFDLPPGALAPPVMLKAALRLAPPDPEACAALQAQFRRGATLLAASTHEGEEALVIAAFLAARKRRPGLRLILAPRHPARGDAVAQLLTNAGLGYGRRSTGEALRPQDPVYLADTLGEMPLWYALAGTCFVGGSLVSKGGHTPYEPASLGCAILHGPHVANFAEAFAMLAQAQAAILVADGQALGAALGHMTSTQAETLGQAAKATLASEAAWAGVDDLAERLTQIYGPERGL